ncbi:MAG: hypothetical protein WCB79_09005 [Halobacteriota archaeon]
MRSDAVRSPELFFRAHACEHPWEPCGNGVGPRSRKSAERPFWMITVLSVVPEHLSSGGRRDCAGDEDVSRRITTVGFNTVFAFIVTSEDFFCGF